MERWKAVPGYEGIYEVSNLGRVKSMNRIVKRGDILQERKERIKKQWANDDGYLQVKLSRDGINTNIGAHRLVAMAFLDNPYDLPEVNHKDGNRQNNCVDNLEWVTHIENIQDSIKRGTHVSFHDTSGNKNPNYGNRKLSVLYAEHPDIALQKQSRPGEQNGRSKAIRATLIDGTQIDFPFIRAGAEWLCSSGLCIARPEHAAINMSKAANSGRSYCGIFFQFL